ncbi:MAG TPA: hypothetical protein VJ817_10105, partial [Gemmatimonadales bacterium]|nr:hypothetical protein [Gemmatimonadales bacterium]
TLPVVLALAAVLAACSSGDARFEQLTVGITKDSALRVMGSQAPTRTDPFLTEGKFIEVMYFTPAGSTDSLPDREMSPLVTVDGKLVGWGWEALDSVAAATKIPVAEKPGS